MPLDFTCPHCGQRTMVGDQYAGQTGPCARCGQMVTIPAAAGGGPAAAYPAPPQRSKAGLIIGIIVGILVLCGGGIGVVGWLGYRAFDEAQQRAESQRDLHQVAIGLHNHFDVYSSLPSPASYDASGKPLLSWRVHLLPYLDQSNLYDQFHLDEPWDSPHNKQLISEIPSVYRMHGDTAAEGKTRILAAAGKDTMFEAPQGGFPRSPQSGITFGQVTDGLSNTVMLLEVPAEQAVIWTKPDDWQVSPQQLDTLANDLAQGKTVRVVMGDASTHTISANTQRDMLRRLFDRRDGEAIDPDWQR
ncbi:MAG: DUF1559 domain-containing protein [Planctomycetia bacterium]|nr:DUF1559 domain-containing protein [Planctomycetia bacterium]